MKFEALLRVRSEAIDLIPAPAKSRTSVDKLVRKKVIKPIDKELRRLANTATQFVAKDRADIKLKAHILRHLLDSSDEKTLRRLTASIERDIQQLL